MAYFYNLLFVSLDSFNKIDYGRTDKELQDYIG